jgi:uncharacterized membrane protein YbhN (UPF0104 family)
VANDNRGQPILYWSSKAARTLLVLLLLGLAVHLLLPQIATLEHSLQIIKGMTWWAVGLAAGAQVVSYLGSGVLLQAVVAMSGDRLSVGRGTLITAASYSIGLVVGGMVGSAAATYRWVHGSGVSAEGALLAGCRHLYTTVHCSSFRSLGCSTCWSCTTSRRCKPSVLA